MLRTKQICCSLIGGITLGVVSTASAQTLLAPDGLQFTPSQTYSIPAPQMSPPPVFLPSGPAYPVEVHQTKPVWPSQRFGATQRSAFPEPTLVPEYDLHGFEPLPAQNLPVYAPVMKTPSMSTWTPVLPKTKHATVQTVVPKSEGGPKRRADIRTPSAARVWQAMGRFR